MITTYRFRPVRGGFTFEFPSYAFQESRPHELATLLVKHGAEDGTVEIRWRHTGVVERYESLHGAAACFRTHLKNEALKIRGDRLQTLFAKTGRGLRPDVREWWENTLSVGSRPWRLRQYFFSPSTRRATKSICEFLEFGSDADTVAFKLRWPELWG
jgi:hypothetical protein